MTPTSRPARRICVVVASRANYSSIKSALGAIDRDPRLELQLVVCGSAVWQRCGAAVADIRADGFTPALTLDTLSQQGNSPGDMVRSTGHSLITLAGAFEELRPDWVVTIGDRFETLATAVAAAYMNIPLAHTMGGEVTGTIDESVRHAVTKLAHVHFVSNHEAARRVVQLGEEPEHVHVVGCPRIDLVLDLMSREARGELPPVALRDTRTEEPFDLSRPFLIVSQHPVTTECEESARQMRATLAAVEQLKLPTVLLWPNIDAGNNEMVAELEQFATRGQVPALSLHRHLPVSIYLRLMQRCACLIGNSSSALREGAYLGTPSVNIGTRQTGRQRSENILDVEPEARAIVRGVRQQLAHGRYACDEMYGDGRSGVRIADVLATEEVAVQKRFRDTSEALATAMQRPRTRAA